MTEKNGNASSQPDKSTERRTTADKQNLTTTSGIPVGDNQNSLTAGPRGPVLMQDFHLLEKMAHFNRERIPERVVHAKGSGAYGTLTITNPDMKKYTTAKVFEQARAYAAERRQFRLQESDRGRRAE